MGTLCLVWLIDRNHRSTSSSRSEWQWDLSFGSNVLFRAINGQIKLKRNELCPLPSIKIPVTEGGILTEDVHVDDVSVMAACLAAKLYRRSIKPRFLSNTQKNIILCVIKCKQKSCIRTIQARCGPASPSAGARS